MVYSTEIVLNLIQQNNCCIKKSIIRCSTRVLWKFECFFFKYSLFIDANWIYESKTKLLNFIMEVMFKYKIVACCF